MSLQIKILAPDRIFYTAIAEEIILPTTTGQMGILTNHTPVITGLDIGVLLVRGATSSPGSKTNVTGSNGSASRSEEWVSMALMGGFALIKENTVTILVNDAEFASSIDPIKAEQNFLEAQTAFEKAEGRKEKIETSLAFKRARAKYQLVKK
jgi:F0F1-type ATP synthase epsilon subunit